MIKEIGSRNVAALRVVVQLHRQELQKPEYGPTACNRVPVGERDLLTHGRAAKGGLLQSRGGVLRGHGQDREIGQAAKADVAVRRWMLPGQL
eukprot:CAMPEP_0170629486 /NCGR_PEP_ID=MMETSP0224-20130122/33386_1 /TAXON_ID=285029 /ORGANISM="Togula jolla, Strain CCCM 725" /LENGTH=91 /DNA_ID=CAMNT_0010957267 /DNA_START=53 /DNA_END=328 /DNA_ORIENTATION=-